MNFEKVILRREREKERARTSVRERERNEKRMSPRGESKQEKGTQKRERVRESKRAGAQIVHARSLPLSYTHGKENNRQERASEKRARRGRRSQKINVRGKEC